LGPDDFIQYWEVAPGGQHVAYTTGHIIERYSNGFQYADKSIYSVPSEGGPVHQLDQPQFAGAAVSSFERPAFTPDGKSILFAAMQERPDFGGTYRAALDGTASLRLTDNSAGGSPVPWRYMLTDDGKQLIYQQEYSGDLRSVASTGGTPVRLNQPLTTGQLLHGSFLSTPDSSRVLYLVGNDGGMNLFSVRTDGTQRTPLATTVLPNSPRISPDSNYVSYQRGGGFSSTTLYGIPIAGGAETMLNPDLPLGFIAYNNFISPDCMQVVFLCDIAHRFQ
jgi:Tol biopolymer transport system component